MGRPPINTSGGLIRFETTHIHPGEEKIVQMRKSNISVDTCLAWGKTVFVKTELYT